MAIQREMREHFSQLMGQYEAVTVTGPRQSGKTTLCTTLYPQAIYKTLEDPDTRREAESDYKTFLDSHGSLMIIDEIQRLPQLFSYLQGIIDAQHVAGRFILTGSSQFELLNSISQSLAGRTALLRLLPFTAQEAYGASGIPTIAQMLYTGFYPKIFDKLLNPSQALSFYYNTYVERDVRQLLNVRDLSTFDSFIRLCAARTGQLLNAQSLGNDCGVNQGTATHWISVLEASYIMYRLRPHHNNLNKRIIKSPKLYFFDTGLVCYLCGLLDPAQTTISPLMGSLFETYVVSELIKYRFNNGEESNLYFWRDSTGHEIDVLIDFGTTVLPIEVKLGKTIANDFFKNILFYQSLNPACTKAVLVYGGDRTYRENNVYIISYRDLHILKNLDWKLEIPL